MVKDTRPSESVEDPGLVRVFKSLCPQFEPPCSQTVTNYIERSYEAKKEEIIIEIKTIDSVAVTTDGALHQTREVIKIRTSISFPLNGS